MESQICFAGSYTEGHAGQGITTCQLEPSGALSQVAVFGDIANPSYLVVDTAKMRLYAVHETAQHSARPAAVSAFHIADDYTLSLIGTQPVPGDAPCHLAFDAKREFLAVANYSSGNVALYPLQSDGSLAELADVRQHQGKSVNATRQEAAHAHAVIFSPDNRLLYVVDLGLDEVIGYRFETGRLEPVNTLKLPAGAGPRHLIFHPNGQHAFVVNELNSTLSLLAVTPEGLAVISHHATLPADFLGESTCAALRLHPNGQTVYASNRGHDSVAVFSFDAATQTLILLEHSATEGQNPRDFALSRTAETLVVANQSSDQLVSFRVQPDGTLQSSGHGLALGAPVCVAML